MTKFSKIKTFFTGIVIVATLLVGADVVSQNVKLNPIKPAKNQILTDEQQGIMAVRKAKASVVSVVGSEQITAPATNKNVDITSSFGSGVILESNGYILTNSHVVSDPEETYYVFFADGSKFQAKIIGTDPYDDLALIKIEASGLPAVTLGNSDNLETGQSVFAIGNTLGKYQNTVTRGVVSGLGRDINVEDNGNTRPRFRNLIQTDAAISPGNSGGPLINMAGEVVGINTLVDNEGSSLGFAIPINLAKNVLGQLKDLGKVSRPYLGLSFSGIDKSLQGLKNFSVSQGAWVREVISGTAASAAGIKPGDIIIEINQEKVTEQNQLDTIIQKYSAGNQILISLLRGQERIDVPVILREYK